MRRIEVPEIQVRVLFVPPNRMENGKWKIRLKAHFTWNQRHRLKDRAPGYEPGNAGSIPAAATKNNFLNTQDYKVWVGVGVGVWVWVWVMRSCTLASQTQTQTDEPRHISLLLTGVLFIRVAARYWICFYMFLNGLWDRIKIKKTNYAIRLRSRCQTFVSPEGKNVL